MPLRNHPHPGLSFWKGIAIGKFTGKTDGPHLDGQHPTLSRFKKLSTFLVITAILKNEECANERYSWRLELCGPSFNWRGVYSPCYRCCVLTSGKLVSKNTPKKGAFQNLARPVFQNLARPAAEILSLV